MLIFERSGQGRRLSLLPETPVDVEQYIPGECLRRQDLDLPQLSENDISRHYTELAKRSHGVNDGFYPLGSCTMKYNPKLNEEMAASAGFCDIHPLQPLDTVQGCLQVMADAQKYLAEITGMDAVSLQPGAGAHGEFTGLLLIKAYLRSLGQDGRTKIIVPDSAHGTNPASAAMAGFSVINVPSDPQGDVDLAALKEAVGEDTAALMLTNPNTLGRFDKNILQITQIVHAAGGLCYYDGANLNAVVGLVRPGDMGFDVVHLNLHKTFSTPHGGGGPGSGPVGCKSFLAPFLPGPLAAEEPGGSYGWHLPVQCIGAVKAFYGNFLVAVKALSYILTLGADGLAAAATQAVLNANYLMKQLSGSYDMACDGLCMHEFVMSLEKLKQETGVSAMDVAKAILDCHMYPPTMYFPLIVHEALMVEPTETESKETLDQAAQAYLEIYRRAFSDPESLHNAPCGTVIGRVDEVGAARNPRLKYGD
ncbi:MAG: aminomethyl-transferring glycine dehydrogenase subunit GcvPB [Firmicutes bacterium]|nr:aminomethyl-transferring glycine dehydrogenase subunit GcvPB [Bacillota bacterium]